MVIAAREIKHTEVPVVLGRSVERSRHASLAPTALLDRVVEEPQKAIPAIAKVMASGELTGTGLAHLHELPGGILAE